MTLVTPRVYNSTPSVGNALEAALSLRDLCSTPPRLRWRIQWLQQRINSEANGCGWVVAQVSESVKKTWILLGKEDDDGATEVK
ncbi:Protein of unknown function [Gryllus bimaculatus]|nr:Protein of unknown function [Gryllus bimaculatus]